MKLSPLTITGRIVLTGTALGAFAGPAHAETIDLTLTIPRINVAEYHKPYVAIWLEKPGASKQTLAVWYDQNKRNNGGTKWLRDIRTWWREAGRGMTMPADGISGATRTPGPQRLSLPVGVLAPGAYTLVIEAAREAGGRETVRVPFTWNGARANAGGAGQSELGAVNLAVKR